MSPSTATAGVHDRIMAKAFDLFYRQGYQATGINQVIAESGVAKASFYYHFPSKADLLLAYAEETARREMASLRSEVQALSTVRQRFFGPLSVLTPWFESSNYRGCPFQNLMAEVSSQTPKIRDVARRHRENLRKFFRELTDALIKSDPKLARLDSRELSDTYLLLFEGAIAVAVVYRQSWPVDKAIKALQACLHQP